MADEEARRAAARGARYARIATLFRDLGIERFDARLPEGEIRWLDGAGREVARARCAAILSHAPANDSVMWARAIPAFREAGVPTVDPPPGVEDYVEGMDADLARAMADRAAGATDAEFIYAVPTEGGGTLWIACSAFEVVEPEAVGDA